MTRNGLKLFLAGVLSFGLGVGAGLARGDAGLAARIDGLFGNPQLKNALVGVDIVEITGKGAVEVYGHNAGLPLPPASCTKLLTTTAAFERYGAKGAFNTQFFKVGEDLVIVGSGDPGFCDAKLADENKLTMTSVFDGWAEALKKMNVGGYRDLIVDDRVFDGEFVHPDWPGDQYLAYYEAPIGGLNFNANCLDWLASVGKGGVGVTAIPETSYVSITNRARVGGVNQISLVRPRRSNAFELRGTLGSSLSVPESVTIWDPGLFAGTILRDRLAAAGIRQTGVVRRRGEKEEAAGAGSVLIGSSATPVLAVIRRANTNSLNMMAEGLCKRLGYDATGRPGSWESGTAAVKGFVESLGVAGEMVNLRDGSGLSAENRVAAKAFTAVLAHVAGRADGRLFMDAMAVPGEDGTLERRFSSSKELRRVAEGIHAKTGHIKAVSCLSGFLDVGGRRFAFSILCHKYEGNVNPWQEEVCEALYEWAGGR